ncbi:pseudouridylate synthase [Pedobacter yulinensis]|uniref:Pseudouridine synthase n=1 Tax=Pedobacter yulinensis TaxID=2126353 RepID=A0A2T3HP79_9SPHI|nr:pseudouridine synthase [Pedobacter yulinensis]PST84191.1 pseudouridylate synthase [Pedobacter yulinensis]
MSSQNKRNSRDDKSGSDRQGSENKRGRSTGSTDRKTGGTRGARPERPGSLSGARKKPAGSREDSASGARKAPVRRKSESSEGERDYSSRARSTRENPERGRSAARSNDRPERNERAPWGERSERAPRGERPERAPRGERPERASRGERPERASRGERPERAPRGERTERAPRGERTERAPRTERADRAPRSERPERFSREKSADTDRGFSDSRPFRKRETTGRKPTVRREAGDAAPVRKTAEDKGLIRLNRYIANSGICSRRKADELIEAGTVMVNGEVISELGHKVDPAKDEIRYNGELLKREKKVYVLLNKPKDYITTTDDPQERRTVMALVEKASKERIYPVGRLDRNTTGLLLMTNDGDLADKLSHPKNGVTKIYQVELNKNLTQGDMNKIAFGIELEDGVIKPDSVSYVTGGSKKEIGIQIHSGKNRIVRRIFEHLGYEVVKLDRVVFANLTKKDLPRGRWRYLEEHELIQIKHLIK